MAIQFHPVRPGANTVPAVTPARTHAAAANNASQSHSTAGKSNVPEVANSFRAIFSSSGPSNGVARRAASRTGQSTSASSATNQSAGSASQSTTAASSSSATATQGSTAPTTAATAAPGSDPNSVYTAEEVFGANPWVSNPTGVGPTGMTFGYNPLYFATPSTAAQVAQMLGGTVVQDNEFTKNTPGDPFAQSQPNEMVQLPDGALINPGLVASFYTHGYPQWEVNQSIAEDVAAAESLVNPTGT
jgi:hypothetical protein